MDIESERHRQNFYRLLSFLKQLIQANVICNPYININEHVYQQL